jgi:hypothetical protein
MTYRLGELGWLEFERLADSVLDSVPGLAGARWSGRADEGRVAVVSGDVVLPVAGRREGPLLAVVAWSPLPQPGS